MARAMYFSRAPIPFLREPTIAARDARVLHHIGVYAYTPDALARWVALPPHPLEQIERLEQLRPLAAGMRDGRRGDSEVRCAAASIPKQDLARANPNGPTFTVNES